MQSFVLEMLCFSHNFKAVNFCSDVHCTFDIDIKCEQLMNWTYFVTELIQITIIKCQQHARQWHLVTVLIVANIMYDAFYFSERPFIYLFIYYEST